MNQPISQGSKHSLSGTDPLIDVAEMSAGVARQCCLCAGANRRGQWSDPSAPCETPRVAGERFSMLTALRNIVQSPGDGIVWMPGQLTSLGFAGSHEVLTEYLVSRCPGQRRTSYSCEPTCHS
jgi:hypothetical protein